MKTVILIHLLLIILIINFFKVNGIFIEQINGYINYIFMELFGFVSSAIVDEGSIWIIG